VEPDESEAASDAPDASDDDAASVSPSAKLQLASAYRKLHKQKEAIAVLEPLVESNVDREVQDDALEQLAGCQTEIEAFKKKAKKNKRKTGDKNHQMRG